MQPSRFQNRVAGIAIGPILFIVALLAILATAIAAGSSSFSAGSDQENARALAGALLDQCRNYKAAMDRMLLGHGCQPNKLDITPPAFPTSTSWASGNYTGSSGTSRTGNGSCALYDIRGGSLTFTQMSSAALASPSTGLYDGSAGSTEMNYWAGYPLLSSTHCIPNVGTCVPSNSSKKAFITLSYAPIRKDVCEQVNALLKNNVATSAVININDSAGYNMYAGWGLRPDDGNGVGASGGISGKTTQEMCTQDSRSLDGGVYNAYVYYCTLLVR